MPYPHHHDDCDVCGAQDAEMLATHPGVGERPVRWCSRCAGDMLAGLMLVGLTVTVFPFNRESQP